MSAATTTQTGYMAHLDGLRTIAVFAVFIQHWTPEVAHGLPFSPGEAGVQLFFVLSGFLITGILFRARAAAEHRGIDGSRILRRFYARRFLRIFPLYYSVVVLSLIFAVGPARELTGWLVTYTLNIKIALSDGWPFPLAHFWTLAVEEQFYLFWPFAVLFVTRASIVSLSIGLATLAPALRLIHALARPSDFPGLLVVENADALCLGALLALYGVSSNSGRRLARMGLIAGGSIFMLTAALQLAGSPTSWRWTGNIPAILISHGQRTAMVAMFVYVVWRAAIGVPGPLGKVLIWRPIVYLGTVSYGLYVLHHFAPWVWTRLGPRLGMPASLVTDATFRLPFLLALTVAGAVTSWHLLEKPVNRLKRHFPYLPRAQPIALADEVVARPTKPATGLEGSTTDKDSGHPYARRRRA